jgi:fructose-1-phosphate kinase PfkB-like protein
MDEAARLRIPVYLNLEHAHSDPDLLRRYAGQARFCQAVTDAAQKEESDPLELARKLRRTGVETALIPRAEEGSLVLCGDEILRIRAPRVPVVDGCGAGATYSAGFIYGWLQGWRLEDSVRFATAAASLKVTRAGLQMWPVKEIQKTAASLKVETSVLAASGNV